MNASPITKITRWFKFLSKNLHLVGCATVCAKSEVMIKFNMNISSMTSNLEQSDAQSTTYILFCSTLLHLDEGGKGSAKFPQPLGLISCHLIGDAPTTPFMTFTITSGKVFFIFVISTQTITSNLKFLLEIEVIKKIHKLKQFALVI